MCQYLHILSLLTIFSIVNFECLLNSNELSNYKTAFIVFDGIGHKTNENIFQELFFAKRCMTNLNKKWARGFQNETIFMGIQRTIFSLQLCFCRQIEMIRRLFKKIAMYFFKSRYLNYLTLDQQYLTVLHHQMNTIYEYFQQKRISLLMPTDHCRLVICLDVINTMEH